MSTIDRLFAAKPVARAPEAGVPAAKAPADPVAEPAPAHAVVASAPPRAANDGRVDDDIGIDLIGSVSAPAAGAQLLDDAASVEVIGAFAAPPQLTDDEPIDVFDESRAGLAAAVAGMNHASEPMVAAAPEALPVPVRRTDWRAHALAAALVACALLVIVGRSEWLGRAQSAAPAVAGPALPLPAAVAHPAPAEAPAAAQAAAKPLPQPVAQPVPQAVAQAAAAAVAPQAAAAAAAATPATGTLMLAISPWGEVLVDGIGRGVTAPLDRIALAPGSYRVEVRNPAAARYATTIDIHPGESITLQHHF